MEVAAVAAIVLGGYVLSILLHPYTNCSACDGRGRHSGAVFRNAHRPCHKCSGRGRRRRLGAKLIGRGERTSSSGRMAPPTN
ncbi:MAG TPA: hypothetical protein VGJ41_06770 [Nocardioides sp.]|jgi:DnaJ-class molecular chaperone